MRRADMLKYFLFIAAFLAIGGTGAAGAGDIQSEGGLFTVHAQMEPLKPRVGSNTVILTVYDRRTRAGVEGAAIEVIPWMTLHGHGSPKKTLVQEKGNGTYRADSVYFSMEGDWDLRIKIRKDGKEDTAAFTIKNVKRDNLKIIILR